jgi:hypothetical protein
LIVVQFFWNHLCTQCSHVQILCNNLVGRTFSNIKFIVDLDEWKPSHGRRLCLLSQRRCVQIAVHPPPFLAHLRSLCATAILEHVIQIHYQTLSESFRRYR